jgi:two-component system, chemotaxis family, sensor kinase CheA
MDDELLQEFIDESRDHLATIEEDLLRLEDGGADIDEDLVNKVFRAAHSIKGGSSFFGFVKVKELAHKAETVLDQLRARKMEPNPEVINILLAAFDQLSDMINAPQASEQVDIAELLVSLTGLASSYLPPAEKPALQAQVELASPVGSGRVTLPQTDLDRARRTGEFIYWVDCDLVHDIEARGLNILSLFHDLSATGEILDCAIDAEAVGTLDDPIGNRVPLRLVIAAPLAPDRIGELLATVPAENIHLLLDPHEAAADAVADDAEPIAATAPVARPAPKAAPRPAKERAKPAGNEETLRVNVGLLENLMNLAGELVLSRNQLRAAVAQDNREMLAAASQRVNQVTSELQDLVMQTRLQPIGNVFAKFPRVVRDLARSLGKEIDLDIRGQDVALDKTLIEGLSDPLTHMVRNAVDHGIETTEERLRQGKNPAGRVRIEARHEAGQVVLEIADDGKGLDPQKVAEVAVRKGLLTAEQIQALSDEDKQALIFLPGLSTAQQVSDLSGRGVGMDVVKTNLDRLGGQVEIASAVGLGSTFRIKLPLTLAIMPSLIVSVGSERFAIPQASIEELLRLRPDEVKSRIETVGDREVLRLRDRLLPLARFEEFLSNGAAGTTDRVLEIAVVSSGSLSYGLVVGAFHDSEEVVVKPLGRRFKDLNEYAGATILGDGAVALILDIAGLAGRAGLAAVAGAARAAELEAAAEAGQSQEKQSLLIFHNGPEEPCAVPLAMVQRIERVSPAQIERLGRQRTMQYRGSSLPLATLGDVASVGDIDSAQDLVVLVTASRGREVGLLGTMPVDVTSTQAAIDQTVHRQPGIVGSAIIDGRTTLIVDQHEVFKAVGLEIQADDDAAVDPGGDPAPAPPTGATILLAEDSDFFRSQVKKHLESEGFQVLEAADGQAAWELLLDHAAQVKVVVTDIEMPRLSGLELAGRIRGDERTAHLPIIAVSSLAGEEDIARGRAAGIDDYQVKLDRDGLLASVRTLAEVEEPVMSC